MASLSQGRIAAAKWGLFTHKSVPVIFEPPCTLHIQQYIQYISSQILPKLIMIKIYNKVNTWSNHKIMGYSLNKTIWHNKKITVLRSHLPWLQPTFYILLRAAQNSHQRWPQQLYLIQRSHSTWCPYHPQNLSPLRAVFTLGIQKHQLPRSPVNRASDWSPGQQDKDIIGYNCVLGLRTHQTDKPSMHRSSFLKSSWRIWHVLQFMFSYLILKSF